MPKSDHRFRRLAPVLFLTAGWAHPAIAQAAEPPTENVVDLLTLPPAAPPSIVVLTTPARPPLVRPPAPPPPPMPRSVREMVTAAVATGDKAKVATVVALAKQTNPNYTQELDTIHRAFLAEKERAAQLAAAEEERRLRAAGVFERWSGRGQIGAFQSSGNSSNVGISLALSLKRQGIDWSHEVRTTADYQRSNGVTSREQFSFVYEPRYQINKRMFSYALGQYERDRFQGVASRFSASGGLGYHLIDGSRIDLTVQGGPAWRRVEYIGGGSSSNLAALAALDFDWRITDKITFTQDTNMVADAGGQATLIVDSNNTSLSLVSGLEAKISDRLTTRLSHTLEYDSNPPTGAVSTDQLTRFTLVYGF